MRNIVKKVLETLVVAVLMFTITSEATAVEISGELRMWHKITLTFDGPETSEIAVINPFTNYRLDVTFTQGDVSYVVPGYFAADGNAANTGALEGNKWRVHFSPPTGGIWNYSVLFRKGANIHDIILLSSGESAGFMDGERGFFKVSKSNKKGRDMRAKGRLEYVGGHYLRFKGTGNYFLKQGVDTPENLLSYADFDGDFKTDGYKDQLVKTWEPHVQDWKEGDPTWADGKGKGLIGAINYLASKGLNSFSFLTFNINGDDQNVFPYINYSTYDRFDVSRLDQWEIVFEHGSKMGMFLHFKTGETENQTLLDHGDTGVLRKLYYRELIARFSHHPALNWNMGEENGVWAKYTVENGTAQNTKQRLSMAQYFFDKDPYKHHIVLHNGQQANDLYGEKSKYTGWSRQTNQVDFSDSYAKVKDNITKSVDAGKPWAVSLDEPGDAKFALRPDADPGDSHHNGRKNAIWGTFMAGGWGNEWYFGYNKEHSDLSLQDFRSRDKWWDYPRIFLELFNNNKIPFWQMTNLESKISNDNWARGIDGKVYIIYLKNGGTADYDFGQKSINLVVKWYNPRTGGALKSGSVKRLKGSGTINIGEAPFDKSDDWIVIVGCIK